MSLFETIKALLPTGKAWRIVVDKTLRRFFEGLAEQPQETKGYVDQVFLDLFPPTTRQLGLWCEQFGVWPSPSDSRRRRALDASWKATGGQSPRYIQDVLQAAGFDVYVHEWWWNVPIIESELSGSGTLPPTITVSGIYLQLTGLGVRVVEYIAPTDPGGPLLTIETSVDGGATWSAPLSQNWFGEPWEVEVPGAPGAFLTLPLNVEYTDDNLWEPSLLPELPRVPRNPLHYADQPLTGLFQCEDDTDPDCPEAYDGPEAPYCNDFLVNDPGYIVNLDLTRRAPPPIPADPDAWRYFLYIGGENFPERAQIPAARRAEFEWFIQKLKPSQQWVVTRVEYVAVLATEDGDDLVTEDDDLIMVEA
jgi:hypothetical protein